MKSRKIIEYKTITSGRHDIAFDEAVNEAIKEGWQPLGGHSVLFYDEDNSWWDAGQTMVKYEE